MNQFRAKKVQGKVPGPAERTSVQTVELTGAQKRRGERVNSRVPVAVEWDSEGEQKRVEAQTRVVGPYGCLMVLAHKLEAQQQIRVTNLVSKVSSSAVVIWRGNERAEGWELGTELINPPFDFWGLEL